MLSICLKGRRFQRTLYSAYRCASSEVLREPKSAEVIARENNLPIERTSLSRGLALNRFEKVCTTLSYSNFTHFLQDFVIYPEFTEADDVVRIKQFSTKLRDDLVAACLLTFIFKLSFPLSILVAQEKDSKSEGLPDSILAVLLKNGVFQTFVPSEYGGVGLNNKELLCMNEALGIDLSTYMFVNQSYAAARIIQIFGSDEQKERYLPKLASLQLKPAICFTDL